MRVAVIVNPTARKGRALALAPIQGELAQRLGPVEPMFTEALGHAIEFAPAPWPTEEVRCSPRGIRHPVQQPGALEVNDNMHTVRALKGINGKWLTSKQAR